MGGGNHRPRVLSIHLRCMETLNGFCRPSVIAQYADCAVRRLAANNATVLFVATMHARDRHTLASLVRERTGGRGGAMGGAGPGSLRVVHANTTAERVESGVRWQEDARVIDTWLLARADELLLSPSSTLGYMAMALTDAPATMLNTCKPPPGREASFHLAANALKGSAACRQRATAFRGGDLLPESEGEMDSTSAAAPGSSQSHDDSSGVTPLAVPSKARGSRSHAVRIAWQLWNTSVQKF